MIGMSLDLHCITLAAGKAGQHCPHQSAIPEHIPWQLGGGHVPSSLVVPEDRPVLHACVTAWNSESRGQAATTRLHAALSSMSWSQPATTERSMRPCMPASNNSTHASPPMLMPLWHYMHERRACQMAPREAVVPHEVGADVRKVAGSRGQVHVVGGRQGGWQAGCTGHLVHEAQAIGRHGLPHGVAGICSQGTAQPPPWILTLSQHCGLAARVGPLSRRGSWQRRALEVNDAAGIDHSALSWQVQASAYQQELCRQLWLSPAWAEHGQTGTADHRTPAGCLAPGLPAAWLPC